jgi:N utilization substance protein A
MAREAGYRTKIAVWSANEKVDPVGACVGMRGARVKNIVRELNNEKVDLFKWSANIRELVVEALKPAKLKAVEVDEAAHKVTVQVDEENLSLAIGRRGQNARLTQKLTGWEVDVKKEEEVAVQGFEQKLAKATEALAASLQVEPTLAEKIVRAGFLSVEGIAEAEMQDVIDATPDVDPALVTQIHEKARALQTHAQS